MKWNATIIVTFFIPHELTKIVLKSSSKLKVSNWIIWPSELNQKGFPLFPRNIPYRQRLKAPPFSFFGIVRLFFEKKSPKSGPPSIFWCFVTMDVKKCKRILLLARQGPVLAGTWRASSVVWVFREFDTLLWVWYFEFSDFHFPLLFVSLRYGADLCRSRLVLLNFELRWSWEICPWKY